MDGSYRIFFLPQTLASVSEYFESYSAPRSFVYHFAITFCSSASMIQLQTYETSSHILNRVKPEVGHLGYLLTLLLGDAIAILSPRCNFLRYVSGDSDRTRLLLEKTCIYLCRNGVWHLISCKVLLQMVEEGLEIHLKCNHYYYTRMR